MRSHSLYSSLFPCRHNLALKLPSGSTYRINKIRMESGIMDRTTLNWLSLLTIDRGMDNLYKVNVFNFINLLRPVSFHFNQSIQYLTSEFLELVSWPKDLFFSSRRTGLRHFLDTKRATANPTTPPPMTVVKTCYDEILHET